MPSNKHQDSSKNISESTTRHRRRGKKLEDDILASTLELIEQTKYEDLTMDIIAKHAHTNKSVLYRRWDSKADIVAAAVQTQSNSLFSIFQQVPNTDSLEGDLRELFNNITALFMEVHYNHISGLMHERLGGISIRDFFDKFARKNLLSQMVRTFFENAEKRGEINLVDIDPALYDLPMLMLFEALYAPDSDEFDSEYFDHIVSDILMPIYRPFLRL